MTYWGSRHRERTIKSLFSDSNQLIGKFYSETSPYSNVWNLHSEVRGTAVEFGKAEGVTDDLHPGPPYRSGGPFRALKLAVPDPCIQGYGTYITPNFFTWTGLGNGRMKYEGGFYTNPLHNWPGFSEDFINLSLNLSANNPIFPSTSGSLENSVYSKTKPPIEQGGLFVALAEVRDVHHMLKTSLNGFIDIYRKLGGDPRSKILSPKKVADHFLNHNFGWVPFINDIKKFQDNVVNVDSKLEKLYRDNGQWIKRKVFLVNQTEISDGLWGEQTFCSPASNPAITSCFIPTWNAYFNVYETKTTVAQGVGRFRYYLPDFDPSLPRANSAFGALNRQMTLHGARITPLNVYRATPWTWLADWLTPSGDIIAAIQDAELDGMACKYLFLIHHQVRSQALRQFLPFTDSNGGIKELRFSRLIDCKQRKVSDSPFGFGLFWEDLSPKQLAILAALGISRH